MNILTVANQKGGVGKTTLTMQLAAALSRSHRVLVVDVDPQRSTVWWAENVRDRLPFDFAGTQHPNVLGRLRDLSSEYDFVVVDTPGSLENTAILETALDSSDFVLVPMTPDPLAVEPTTRTVSRLLEPRSLRHALVLNRIDPRIHAQHATWSSLLDTTLGLPRLEAYLRQYKAHTDAPVLGELVTSVRDTRRTSPLIWDVTRLGREVAQQLAPAEAGVLA